MPNGFFFTVYTYSPLHAGTGQAMGKVDLPIEREKHTNYPCVYATGVKGSLRSFCKNNGMAADKVNKIFGDEDSNSAAGGAVFTDLKLLLFPVRASEDSFKWVTSEKLIKRFERDYKLAVGSTITLNANSLSQMQNQPGDFDPSQQILLEDFIMQRNSAEEAQVGIADIKKQDVYLLEETLLNYLVTNATQIIARNKLDANKTSENLWYEEALPADSILYSFVKPSVANNAELGDLKNKIKDQVVQIGGGETVGYGICKITVL